MFIYGLIDPFDNSLRYVGFTKKTIEIRLLEHIGCKGNNNHKNNWIKSLISRGRKPESFLIEEVYSDTWVDREKFWISFFRQIGCNLLNISDGGTGGGGMKGKTHSSETRKLISMNRKGKKMSDEWRRKQSEYRTGRPMKKETKEKLRKFWEVNKRVIPESAKIKAREFMTGRKLSQETKDKMKLSQINRRTSEGYIPGQSHRSKRLAKNIK